MEAVRVDTDRMIDELRNRPSAAVIDNRNDDVDEERWNISSYQFVGAAQVVGIPFLLIDKTSSDLSVAQMFPSENFMVLDQASTDNQIEYASKEVKEKLRKLIQIPSAPVSSKNHVSASDALGRTTDVFDRASARQLMSEFFMDGLSLSTIEEELIRLGAPPSWVRSQLRRRSGW